MHTLPPFEVSEYRDRLRRAQLLMAEQGLGALLVTTEMNFRYFSGLHTQSWVMPTRRSSRSSRAPRDAARASEHRPRQRSSSESSL